MFISWQLLHGCRHCFTNSTNELRLLVSMCFWVKKNRQEDISVRKRNCIWVWTSVFVFLPQPLHHLDNWIASFYKALFKSRNYGNYVPVYTPFISRWNQFSLMQKRVQTSNEKGFGKNKVIRTAAKRTETSVWCPTQCTYIPNSPCAVVEQNGLGM